MISVNDNASDVLTVSNDEEDISLNDNSNDVLSVSSDDEAISSSDNTSEVLTVINDNNITFKNDDESILTANVAEDDDLSSVSIDSPASQYTQSSTQYKTFYIGKMTIPKKYKKYAMGSVPSKKNKKAWKQYKAYKKIEKKQLKKFKKTTTKVISKATNKHWNFLSYSVDYKIKYSGKYMYVKYYCDAYRTYNYNSLLNEAWWD